MSQMFQEFQFSIGTFGQNRRRKWLHDLLDRNRLLGQLVFGGAAPWSAGGSHSFDRDRDIPDQTKRTHADRLQICVPESPSVLDPGTSRSTTLPAGDLESRAKDLGTDKLGHDGRSQCGISVERGQQGERGFNVGSLRCVASVGGGAKERVAG